MNPLQKRRPHRARSDVFQVLFFIKMRSVLNQYKLVSKGNVLNTAQNILIKNNVTGGEEEILIPLNLPTFIVGSKNAGKSTVISALIAAEKLNDVYERIFYVYTDHVDSTLAETCHETLVRIPLDQSIAFISEYFKIKSEYMSWVKFLDHLYAAKLLNDELDLTDSNIRLDDMTTVYTDNIIDAYIRINLNINKKSKTTAPNSSASSSLDAAIKSAGQGSKGEKGPLQSPEAKILSHAQSFISKYSESFEVVVDGTTYYMNGLKFDQYDQLIIDDVGVAAPYLFPTSMNKSPLYKFLTISRHILLGTIIAGQDLQQLPKYARKEVNTFLFGVGLDITGIEYTNIPKNKQRDIMNVYPTVQQYNFLIYNGLNNAVTMLEMRDEET